MQSSLTYYINIAHEGIKSQVVLKFKVEQPLANGQQPMCRGEYSGQESSAKRKQSFYVGRSNDHDAEPCGVLPCFAVVALVVLADGSAPIDCVLGVCGVHVACEPLPY